MKLNNIIEEFAKLEQKMKKYNENQIKSAIEIYSDNHNEYSLILDLLYDRILNLNNRL